MPFVEAGGSRLFYDRLGSPSMPVILQVGGPMFGRHNFDRVNDRFRANFQLLTYDSSGYGRSEKPLNNYSILAWADEAAALLKALGVERACIHGTSMGGMIAIAIAAKYPELVIAACADCTYARPDRARQVMLRTWRRMIESMPLDDFCDLLTIQSVSAEYLDLHPELFEATRVVVGMNSTFTLRQSCLAREHMDLEPLVRNIRRPILFTNGSDDSLTPTVLGPSGFSVVQILNAIPEFARYHEFKHARHAGLIECPDEAVRVVTEFFLGVIQTNAAPLGPSDDPARQEHI